MTETTNYLAAHPRCWFAGEGRDEDPRSQTEDLGDNNMKANEYGIRNLKRVIANLPQWTHQDNYQYADLSEMYQSVRDQMRRYTGHVMKHIGGRYLNNMPGKKAVEAAPAAMPLEAIDWLGRNVLEAPLWLYPETITDKLNVDPSKEMENQQNIVLSRVLSADVINKIYNSSYTSAGALKMDAYFTALMKVVWKPLKGDNGMADKMRRTLERNYLGKVAGLLGPKEEKPKNALAALLVSGNDSSRSSDAMLYLLQHLDEIETFVKAQETSATGINKLHYQDLERQIKLIRDSRTTVK